MEKNSGIKCIAVDATELSPQDPRVQMELIRFVDPSHIESTAEMKARYWATWSNVELALYLKHYYRKSMVKVREVNNNGIFGGGSTVFYGPKSDISPKDFNIEDLFKIPIRHTLRLEEEVYKDAWLWLSLKSMTENPLK